MAYQISWTAFALEDYRRIIEYLNSEWSTEIAVEFESIVNKKLKDLALFQKMGIRSEKIPSIRSILLTKHNRIYYTIANKSIRVLSILDTRKNPADNPF